MPTWLAWLALALPLAVVVGTVTYWAPLQTRLSAGLDRQLLRRLLTTHWIRVALISAHGAVLCWIAAVAFA